MCKISILLPVFNVQSYIIETIESVLAQSFSDFELIIIDDYSTDNTSKIIEEYCLVEQRIKYLKNYKNLGISKTLNNGLGIAKGKYIARIDGDDLMGPERLERQLNFLEGNADYGLVGCWVNNIDENGLLINKCEYPVTHEQALKCITICSPVLHIWMARSDLYQSLSGYRDTNPAEDYDFLLRAVDLGFKIGNLPYYDADIRLRGGNTMSVAALKQRKAFNFLRALFIKGQINTDPSLSLESITDLGNDKILNSIHNLSIRMLRKGLEESRTFLKYFYLSCSLISPYTLQDVVRRRKFKKLMKFKNKD